MSRGCQGSKFTLCGKISKVALTPTTTRVGIKLPGQLKKLNSNGRDCSRKIERLASSWSFSKQMIQLVQNHLPELNLPRRGWSEDHNSPKARSSPFQCHLSCCFDVLGNYKAGHKPSPLHQHQPTHPLRQPCMFFTIAAVWVLYTNGGEKIVLEPGKIMRLDKILCKTWAPLACNWLIQEYLSPVFLFTQPVKHNFTKSGNGQCCEQLWQENTHHWSLKWNTHFYNLIRNKHLYNLNQNSHPCNLRCK